VVRILAHFPTSPSLDSAHRRHTASVNVFVFSGVFNVRRLIGRQSGESLEVHRLREDEDYGPVTLTNWSTFATLPRLYSSGFC
jgi:hypothetical protein